MTPARCTSRLAAVAFGLLALPALAAEGLSAASSTETVVAARPPAGTAAAPASAPDRSGGRELGGHLFMPVLGIVGPFATTSFGTFLTLGAGSTEGAVSLQLPGMSSSPQTFSGKVSYAVVGGVIGYEYAFLRDFAARLVLSETLYSGTTGTSAAVVGTNARLGGDLGLTGGLTFGNSLRVSVVFDANYAPRIGLLLGPAIKSAFDSCSTGITDCRFDFGKLFEQQNILTLTPGVAAAWAPLNALGVTANVSYSYLSIDTVGSGVVSQGAMSLGAAVDFDLRNVCEVPVGVQAAWNTQLRLSGADTSFSFTDLGGGLFYTGRKELSLGLQALNRRFRVVPGVDVSWSTILALIGLRYYWQ